MVRRQDGGLMDRDEGLAPCIYDMGKEYEPLRCDVWTRITTKHARCSVRVAPQTLILAASEGALLEGAWGVLGTW